MIEDVCHDNNRIFVFALCWTFFLILKKTIVLCFLHLLCDVSFLVASFQDRWFLDLTELISWPFTFYSVYFSLSCLTHFSSSSSRSNVLYTPCSEVVVVVKFPLSGTNQVT